ncbi:hypothetical protein HY994_02000 [Candidatus Micrarchaeota archaeon]|nr:hypothetical protein [Candidatus Micrarchaeota archaeon]
MGNLEKKGKALKRRFGLISRTYSSKSLRTIQTALALSEASHPGLRTLLNQKPDELSHPALTEGIRKIGLQKAATLFIDGTRASRWSEKSIEFNDLLNLAVRLSRQNKRHALFVSHVEVLAPILENLRIMNPDSFESSEAKIQRRIDRVQKKIGILGRTTKQRNFFKTADRMWKKQERAEDKGDWDEARRLERIRIAFANSPENEALHERVEKQRKKLGRSLELLKKLKARGIHQSEHFTLKFTPKGASLIFRGREHRLQTAT